jgi:hypothetical protein
VCIRQSLYETKSLEHISSPEYWSELCPSTPNFRELGLKLWSQLQFKCDLKQKAFWHLTLEIQVLLWNCVEIVQEATEIQKCTLSHFCQKVEIEHTNIREMFRKHR